MSSTSGSFFFVFDNATSNCDNLIPQREEKGKVHSLLRMRFSYQILPC
jgi:hypothetical protein